MKTIENMIRPELFQYVVNNIWPEYEQNDGAHDIEHVNAVLSRALELNESLSLHQDAEEIFVAVSYHDVRCHINREMHETLSAEYFMKDDNMHRYFSPERIQVIHDAIKDHRASSANDPRNELGKLLSSADRPIFIAQMLRRHWKHHFLPNVSSLDTMAEQCLAHCKRKFGKEGYACNKVYFDDGKYAQFLKDMQDLTSNTNTFKAKYREVNLADILKETETNSLFVKELRLLLTQSCNYDCVFCHQEGVHNLQSCLLKLDDYLFLYDTCEQHFGWTTVTLSGGEPLLYPHFDELVSELAKRKCRIAVVTNGEFIDKHIEAIKLLKRINISVPSFNDAKYHSLVRKTDKLKKVLRNIELVRENAPKIGCRVNMVLSGDSRADWLKAVDFVNQHGCGIKFIELWSDDPSKKATISDAVEVLTEAGAVSGSVLDDRRVLMKSNPELKKENILLTRFICDHARRSSEPGQACREMLDMFITPSGNVNTCAVTSAQESILDSIRNRDGDALAKRIREINSRIGNGCPISLM